MVLMKCQVVVLQSGYAKTVYEKQFVGRGSENIVRGKILVGIAVRPLVGCMSSNICIVCPYHPSLLLTTVHLHIAPPQEKTKQQLQFST